MGTEKLLLSALAGKKDSEVPFWFMRQAGRYLPEYRELRKKAGGFLDLVYNSELAAEITLQPLRRFPLSAAILFSDILVVPHALGVKVEFAEGEGPIVETTNTQERIDKLSASTSAKIFAPVIETVRLVKKDLSKDVALIGFAGSPWTVACYMLRDKRDKEHQSARLFAHSSPKLMNLLIEKITGTTVDYLRMQIDAGAEAIQLFDSWAGLLSPDQFAKWSIAPTKKIVSALKQSHPTIPIIGFARGAGTNLKSYAKETGVNCIGVDQQTDIATAVTYLQKNQAVQGNLDPLLLATDLNSAIAQAKDILDKTKNTPSVFNYGHGMIPETPVENVAAMCEFLKSYRYASDRSAA